MMAMCENEGFLVCREKEKERGGRCSLWRDLGFLMCRGREKERGGLCSLREKERGEHGSLRRET